jgi:hypothetical protein
MFLERKLEDKNIKTRINQTTATTGGGGELTRWAATDLSEWEI